MLTSLPSEGWRTRSTVPCSCQPTGTRSPFPCSCQARGAIQSYSHLHAFLGVLLYPHLGHCVPHAFCALSLSDLLLHSLMGKTLKGSPEWVRPIHILSISQGQLTWDLNYISKIPPEWYSHMVFLCLIEEMGKWEGMIKILLC